MSQDRVFTGVDGHVQIGGDELAFSAYTWVGATSTLPMWTAGSSPFPDELPCLQQPLSLVVRGFFADGLNPSDLFTNGDEVEDVILFVDDEIKASCDFALITGLTVGVTAEGNSFFQLVLTSSWNYNDFSRV